MVGRAEISSSNISVIIHPESILFPDFILTLNLAYRLNHDWFLIASSKRASLFPFFMNEDGKQWLREDGKPISTRKLQENLGQSWKWDYCEGRILMAWNNRDVPLLSGVLPPFLFGKGVHNHWLINEVYHSNYRFVFDASLTITNLHVLDPVDAKCISSSIMDWGYNGNFQLAEMYGLFSSDRVNFSNFVKLVRCGRQYMFTSKDKTVVYPPQYRSSNLLLKGKIMQFRRQRKVSTCLASFSNPSWIMNYSLEREINFSMPLRISYGLDSLLRIVADESKTVVLGIAGYSYKDMLMSWVCRLRRLMVNNFLVCALDDETYEFSILQGIPVFRDSLAPKNISFNDCHFGTKCFQKVTKTKSRLVLQILKLGYNVLLSDVDVYWFKNPIPLLKTFGPAVLVAQSDEYNLTVPINLPRRLNSGFYYARSDDPTIWALNKVVIHAMNSDLSEQPSFYDTLCGQGGSNRIGDDKCREPETNLTVQFLNRTLFPNGAFLSLWEETNVRETCENEGCYVLHNNWISGRIKKLERQIHSGLWEYDISSRMCLQNWHNTKVMKFD